MLQNVDYRDFLEDMLKAFDFQFLSSTLARGLTEANVARIAKGAKVKANSFAEIPLYIVLGGVLILLTLILSKFTCVYLHTCIYCRASYLALSI